MAMSSATDPVWGKSPLTQAPDSPCGRKAGDGSGAVAVRGAGSWDSLHSENPRAAARGAGRLILRHRLVEIQDHARHGGPRGQLRRIERAIARRLANAEQLERGR